MSVLREDLDIPTIPFLDKFTFRVKEDNGGTFGPNDRGTNAALIQRFENLEIPDIDISRVFDLIAEVVGGVLAARNEYCAINGIEPNEPFLVYKDMKSYVYSHGTDAMYHLELIYHGKVLESKFIIIEYETPPQHD